MGRFPATARAARMAIARHAPAAATAQCLTDGLAASPQGDHVAAAEIFRTPAERGVAAAQNSLGVGHDTGEGVPQGFVLAHRWFNLVA